MAGRSLLWSYGGAIQDEQRAGHPQLARDGRGRDVHEGPVRGRDDQRGLRLEPGLQQPGARRGQAVVHRQLDLGLPHDAAGQPEGRRGRVLRPRAEGPEGRAPRRSTSCTTGSSRSTPRTPTRRRSSSCTTRRTSRARRGRASCTTSPRSRSSSPKLGDWLDDDPFGSKPANKLAVLKDALDWSTNVGHRGYANTAIGEVFGTFIIPNMYARAARGRATPAGGGGARGGADQADLREVAQAGPDRRRRVGGARGRGQGAEQALPRRRRPRDRRRRPRDRPKGSTSSCSGPRAAARRRCCGRSPGSRSRPRARS